MVYGVILIYYDKYYKKAISEFTSLVSSINRNYKIIVVSNNDNLCNKGFIKGDNEQWEFSGWDVALRNIASNLKEKDSVIFSNDTFCYHNSWEKRDVAYFKLNFKAYYLKNCFFRTRAIIGSVQSLGEEFNILGHKSDTWVSTYLFMLTGGFFKELTRLSIPFPEINNLVYLNEDNKIHWSNAVSNNLREHITSWIFPNSDTDGWYNKDATLTFKVAKIKAILNEKHLSAKCCSLGGNVIDVYVLKRIRRKVKEYLPDRIINFIRDK